MRSKLRCGPRRRMWCIPCWGSLAMMKLTMMMIAGIWVESDKRPERSRAWPRHAGRGHQFLLMRCQKQVIPMKSPSTRRKRKLLKTQIGPQLKGAHVVGVGPKSLQQGEDHRLRQVSLPWIQSRQTQTQILMVNRYFLNQYQCLHRGSPLRLPSLLRGSPFFLWFFLTLNLDLQLRGIQSIARESV